MTELLIGLGCFALHVAVTLTWLRLPGRRSPVARHAISAFGTHFVGMALGGWLMGAFSYWPVAAVSGFLATGWLFAFSAVYKSVSLRILAQLQRAPGHVLEFESIAKEYVHPEFMARIMLLVKMGFAEETHGGYALTVKGSRIARRIALIQRAWGIEVSGLYSRMASPQREEQRERSIHPHPHDRRSPGIIPPVP